MTSLIKTTLVAGILATVTILTGCSSLDPDTFSAEIHLEDSSNWWSGSKVSTVLTIRSNVAEEIAVTNVSINGGQCGYEGYRRNISFPQHFKMGQMLQLQLKGCSADNVVKLEIETDKGTASYSFN